MSELEARLRKFYALPPYNTFTNICAYNGIFYESIVYDYGKQAVKEMTVKLQDEIDFHRNQRLY